MNAHQRRLFRRIVERLHTRLDEVAPGWNAKNPTAQAELAAHNFVMSSPEVVRLFKPLPHMLDQVRRGLADFRA